jgi:hypothetical protein
MRGRKQRAARFEHTGKVPSVSIDAGQCRPRPKATVRRKNGAASRNRQGATQAISGLQRPRTLILHAAPGEASTTQVSCRWLPGQPVPATFFFRSHRQGIGRLCLLPSHQSARSCAAATLRVVRLAPWHRRGFLAFRLKSSRVLRNSWGPSSSLRFLLRRSSFVADLSPSKSSSLPAMAAALAASLCGLARRGSSCLSTRAKISRIASGRDRFSRCLAIHSSRCRSCSA